MRVASALCAAALAAATLAACGSSGSNDTKNQIEAATKAGLDCTRDDCGR